VPSISTARGSIDSSQLGVTLMHEHIFIIDVEVWLNYPSQWESEEGQIANAVSRLNDLKARGVDSIVDLTVVGLGRFIPRIAQVAQQTPLNIIFATGIYTYRDAPFFFHLRVPRPGAVDIMTEMFVRDIDKGVGETGLRAGILKCATDEHGVTKDIERILRAVAQAHRQTGVPISTHTFARGKVGLDQQRIFREEGVDLTRVVIGHCGDSTDLDYLEQLVGAGSYIGMDRFGLDTILPFEQRVNTVAEMCRRGHARSMVLSHDANCFFHWLPRDVVSAALPRWSYKHIHNDVIPALKQKGVTDEQIHTMLVENPRHYFEKQGAY
jgi:phosphotriesterase-related protein